MDLHFSHAFEHCVSGWHPSHGCVTGTVARAKLRELNQANPAFGMNSPPNNPTTMSLPQPEDDIIADGGIEHVDRDVP